MYFGLGRFISLLHTFEKLGKYYELSATFSPLPFQYNCLSKLMYLRISEMRRQNWSEARLILSEISNLTWPGGLDAICAVTLIDCIWLHEENEAHRHVSINRDYKETLCVSTSISLSNRKINKETQFIFVVLEKPNPRCCYWGNEGLGGWPSTILVWGRAMWREIILSLFEAKGSHHLLRNE